MPSGEFYDAVYFGDAPGARKSNYGPAGGYRREHADPEAFCDAVLRSAKEHGLHTEWEMFIIEVGCAKGYAVQEFRRRGHGAYGFDISPYAIAHGVCGDEGVLAVADITSAAFEQQANGPCDVLCSKDVLEHLTEDVIDEVLLRLDRVTIDGFQYHIVNTGEHEHQAAHGDVSHTLLRPLLWWTQKGESLGIKAVFRAT